MFPSGDRPDGGRRSTLHSAAASGSKGAFDAVLAGMRKYASPEEVRHYRGAVLGSGFRQACAFAAAGLV